MLEHNISARPLLGGECGSPARQGGVVLMISLMILVVLTIAGIALVRSVDTTNLIAGNLAFQQSATHSAEAGTEDAIRLVLDPSSAVYRQTHHLADGYSATAPHPGNSALDYDAYLATMINATPVSAPTTKTCSATTGVCVLPLDSSGNTVSYAIQRLCEATGDPVLFATGCAAAPERYSETGNTLASGKVPLPMTTQYYYRITTRVTGPRNTVSYIQTIVAK
jgi:Tfp pilus assembly protein PilX